ncbi:MAG: Gfo/Idh/MocA family oxidoreductase [Caldilineaceae bacterium]|nr:Gfo/Idh/MocA family oxidoreductase [Caldilineaceae bacterium]MCB0142823.1 Gfo/Idh/MocA family oxidoreductase [Caldilineaceae bacterium]MCB9151896.1 Gfo/Idh/MocA family oxidoreductase [Caldilineaceae bacterium]MCB9158086.1 Gfo/Idh/MocA family oxidoreductase [Caldilineaceae bacterium]
MTQKIRWGIISTANINKALLNPIRQATRSELSAVASRDGQRARDYAAAENIPKAYGSYEEMLADPDIDVVYNPLPNALHKEWTVKAAQAGKHVLCEKPLVTNLADLAAVEAAANANGVTIFEAFMYLHHPQTRKALEMVQAGKLGTVQQINSWFHFYLPPERSSNIRLSAPLEGGSLWDVGVYPNSMAIVMAQAGAPAEVWASQIVGETGVDVGMRAQLRFENGIIAQISSGFRTPFREGTHIVGDQGALEIIEPWKPGLSGKESRMTLTLSTGGSTNIVTPAVDPYLCEVQAMEACILDGAAPLVPLTWSRNFLRSVLAIYESAKSGQIVKL